MIFAAKGGTPLVPVSANTHKIEGLLQLLDLDLAVQDPFDLVARSDDIAGRAIEHVRDGGTDDRIRSRVDELADLARENVSFLVG